MVTKKGRNFDLYQVDAFTDELFKGNPAAVVPLDAWLEERVLQSIAAENNLSETVFFVPSKTQNVDFHIRWFTPTDEVDLCGHATLAASYVIFHFVDSYASSEITFETNDVGVLKVKLDNDLIQLDFPARVAKELPVPVGLEKAIGAKVLSFWKAHKNMAVLESELAVRSANIDLNFVKSMEGDGLILTAPGETSDCSSRYFAPNVGVPEDPVTGSAHCTVVPYWAERLGKNKITAKQVSKRSGDLYCEWLGDRVSIAGNARLYFKGQIYLDD